MKPEELHNIFAAEEEFWWYAGMRAITDALLKPMLRRGRSGLDAGCGTGYNAILLQNEYGARMFGVNRASLAIEYSRGKDFTRSCVGSVTKLPFRDEAFDF